MKILLAEDDCHIAQSLTEALLNQQYSVDVAPDGLQGWDFVQACSYDLLLLDVTVPKLDGLSLCRKIRANGYQVPVLMLTARDSTADKVAGLDAGADDYVVKPYELQELSARIRALIRRGRNPSSATLEWENLQLDPNTCQANYADQILTLTPKEYRLLELLIRSGRHVLSRSAILDNLWTFDETPTEDAVKALVKRLRQKLKTAGASDDFIETVYGFGYHLK
ncbi:MAG: response regulator transcription factor [Richelia sp. RM2_1_2]|nr:response regulator transcription factor [Richelia sp. SM2_1_7]NJM18306.1 response regulator transcription factor [Richelia sp. SM1_7_0]NJN08374.1 response regulator transcription factor [Richelia sp. RM1_1_1]NJO26917.1 response regulator transcription factor [Richelia sp. SL_2_1]NJO62150.1 response regulator transcription factor [Richelia sp. RM2_1_2]NJS17110.1 response regulator transcription factor [Nostocaceae cyanobacterium CSU_2_110]